MSVITLANVKTQLDKSDTEHDTFLTDLIDDVISEAESDIGAKLEAVTAEVVYLNGGKRTLYLPHLNISNVSVWQDSDREWADEDLLDSDYYSVYVERGKIQRNTSTAIFTKGNKVVKVQYDGGYSSSTLPKDLKRALIKQIAFSFRRRKDLGLQSVSYPDGSINRFATGEWLPEVEKVLERYRRMAL